MSLSEMLTAQNILVIREWECDKSSFQNEEIKTRCGIVIQFVRRNFWPASASSIFNSLRQIVKAIGMLSCLENEANTLLVQYD